MKRVSLSTSNNPNTAWSSALKSYVLHKELHMEEIVTSTSEAIVITDKYPKVRLILFI